MDHQDKLRTLSNREKLLTALKARGVLTNHEARAIGGSRAMGRIHELIHAGEPITVRKLAGSTWEIRYGAIAPPLGPDSTTPQLLDSSRSQLGLF